MRKFIKKLLKHNEKSSVVVYVILRFLVIVSMIGQIINGNYENALLCLLSLLLLTLPYMIQKRFKITLPNTLEIMIFLFIFAAEILGEINHFFIIIPNFDTLLHTINGFLCAAIGFSLVDLLNNNAKNVNLSPIYIAIVAVCFSMTIGIIWEFFEYSVDMNLKKDMQKDTLVQSISSVELNKENKVESIYVKNIKKTVIYALDENNEEYKILIDGGYLDIGLMDTMKDLIVNFIGAISFSAIGFLYLLNNNKYKFATSFLPRKNLE